MHPCTEEAQDRRQSVITGSSDTKTSACESSYFSHCQQVYGDKSPFIGAKHWRHTPPFTTIGVLSLAWQIQGQSLLAIPAFGADKCSVEALGGCRSVLTFRMSSLAEWDIRILSHQAGHLVFMYCLPWLESSL